MQKIVVIISKAIKYVIKKALRPIYFIGSYIVFYTNEVRFKSFVNTGVPKVMVSRGGKLTIGDGFKSNNREMSNPIGRFNKCSLIVGRNAILKIGDNVGMSSTAIVCHDSIDIGNNVRIGGNVVIYDTDFHSLNYKDRLSPKRDILNTKTTPISIGNNVFIGAHSTILKGCTIGDNSIIGACSVVVKDIPSNEIWGGNPAKKIRSI